MPMDQQQLASLVRLHQAQIYRYLRYLGAQNSDAEDLVQDVFVAAYRNEKQPDFENDQAAAAWLRGIARNKFLMFCRSNKRNPIMIDSEYVAQAERVWEEEFLGDGDGFTYLEALRKCLDRLNDKHVDFLRMRYHDSASRASMAEKFNMSEDGIKSKLRRLRNKLAECINDKRVELGS